jgi:DNA/RNA endonuclease YhcR with UshA esterase domain
MNQKQLTRLSIMGAIISLIAIYIFVSQLVPDCVKIGKLDRDYAGSSVNVTGKIKDMSMKDGNAFFTLADDTGEINVVLWKDFIEGMKMQGKDTSLLRENATISLVGEVEIYNGQLEIIPSRQRISILG